MAPATPLTEPSCKILNPPPPEPVEVAAVINACVHDVVGPCPWCWDEHDLGLGPAHAFDPDLVLTILNRQAG